MKKTLLLVDDQLLIIKLLTFNLAPLGCEIISANSGDHALKIAQERKIDLLIIDVMMPGMDGFETIEKFRQTPGHQDSPVILLTGRGQSDTRDKASKLKVSGFFNKPFSPIEISTTVKQLLQL